MGRGKRLRKNDIVECMGTTDAKDSHQKLSDVHRESIAAEMNSARESPKLRAFFTNLQSFQEQVQKIHSPQSSKWLFDQAELYAQDLKELQDTFLDNETQNALQEAGEILNAIFEKIGIKRTEKEEFRIVAEHQRNHHDLQSESQNDTWKPYRDKAQIKETAIEPAQPREHQEDPNTLEIILEAHQFIDGQAGKDNTRSLPELKKDIRECRRLIKSIEETPSDFSIPQSEQILDTTKLDLIGAETKLEEDYKNNPTFKATSHKTENMLADFREQNFQIQALLQINKANDSIYEAWRKLEQITPEGIRQMLDWFHTEFPSLGSFFDDEAEVSNTPSKYQTFKRGFANLPNLPDTRRRAENLLLDLAKTEDLLVIYQILDATHEVDPLDQIILEKLFASLDQNEKEKLFDQILSASNNTINFAYKFIGRKDVTPTEFSDSEPLKVEDVLEEIDKKSIVLSKITQYCDKYIEVSQKAKIPTLILQLQEAKEKVTKLKELTPDFIQRLITFETDVRAKTETISVASLTPETLPAHFDLLKNLISENDAFQTEEVRLTYLMTGPQYTEVSQLLAKINFLEQKVFSQICHVFERIISETPDKTRINSLQSVFDDFKEEYKDSPRGPQAKTKFTPQGPWTKKSRNVLKEEFLLLLQEIGTSR